MAATMKAFRPTEGEKPPRLVDMEVPATGYGQILIRVVAGGLCHSKIGRMTPDIWAWQASLNGEFTLRIAHKIL